MRNFVNSVLGGIVTFVTMLCLVTAATFTPANVAMAETGTFSPVWRTSYVDGFTAVTWPDENWTDIATATYSKTDGTSALTVKPGEQWILNGDTNAGILGLNSYQAGNFIQYNADRPPIIFARYFTEEAQLRVAVIRVHRAGNVIHVQKADWTPWDGLLYSRDRYFLTANEKANLYTVGNNPFSSYSNGDKTDPVFYNISWVAAQVAVGQAMQHYQAAIGFIAVPSIRLNQTESTSGGWLKKTTTITTKGYAKPLWYVALPPSAQPYGTVAQICAISYGDGSSCDDAAHVVSSGVSIEEWTGGKMPATEDTMFTDSESHSSWSVLAFALLTIAFVAVGGAALSVALSTAASVGGTVATVGSISAAQIAGTAVAAGAAYTAASELANGGSLVSAQSGYLGSTGNGVASATASGSTYETQLRTDTTAAVITDPLTSSLTAISQQYDGSCGESGSYEGCVSEGSDPGMVPRIDNQENENTVPNTAARYNLCKSAGYTDQNLDRCASGALLTPDEAAAYESSGNVVTSDNSLPPTNGANSAAALYYNDTAPSR